QADRDENEEPRPEAHGSDEADRACGADRRGGEADEDTVRNPRAERTPAELVEGVGPDSDREPEGRCGSAEAAPRDRGCEAPSDDDVGDVPGGVRRMEQGDVVPPSPRRERVPGRPRLGGLGFGHCLTPHMTTAAPRLNLLAWTWRRPAALHSSSWRT